MGKNKDAALKGRATNYERCERFLPYTDNSSWISTGGHGMPCPYEVRITDSIE
jgi:hypothetical protein